MTTSIEARSGLEFRSCNRNPLSCEVINDGKFVGLLQTISVGKDKTQQTALVVPAQNLWVTTNLNVVKEIVDAGGKFAKRIGVVDGESNHKKIILSKARKSGNDFLVEKGNTKIGFLNSVTKRLDLFAKGAVLEVPIVDLKGILSQVANLPL
jgi:hypothetical protein